MIRLSDIYTKMIFGIDGTNFIFTKVSIQVNVREGESMTDLTSKWGENSDKNAILQEYPRPQLRRDSYLNLNGEWDCAISKSKTIQRYERKIVVPFSPESKFSGINRVLHPDEYLHYQLVFDLPVGLKKNRVFLHFGAVDQECEVSLNDEIVGQHKGGYLPFAIDISQSVLEKGNILKVCVTDQTEYSPHARGKQKLNKKGKMDSIFYTPSSGIWKTVWIESVSDAYITQTKLTPIYDDRAIDLTIQTNKGAGNASIRILYKNQLVKEAEVEVNIENRIVLEEIHKWTPDAPHLYDIEITYKEDSVSSYFGMRKYSVDKDKNGVLRFHLNNEPFFFNGLLDQGYWPESLMTAPSDEALKYDILKTKELGFNTIRKHVKVESERFYYHCDKIGMIVWQDMPNGGEDIKKWFAMYLPNISDKLSRKIKDSYYSLFGRRDKEGRKQYTKDLEGMVELLYNYPSIAMWIPFNEGWGQFDAKKATDCIKRIDTTRLINEACGWFDQGGGDVYSIHNYLKKLQIRPQKDRVVALTEFGGYAYPVSEHLFANKEFGYKTYKTSEELTTAYKKLWETQIFPNISSGLSATIYTQTTDIEEEINGLMTYDREVVKMDSEVVKRINQSLYGLVDSIVKRV